jgi:hypothetical protein
MNYNKDQQQEQQQIIFPDAKTEALFYNILASIKDLHDGVASYSMKYAQAKTIIFDVSRKANLLKRKLPRRCINSATNKKEEYEEQSISERRAWSSV